MNLSNLKPAQGSVHKDGKRVGRGQGSGKGGTSTRGHKGAKSRSGFSTKIGFEGGQMPLQRRVPKFGFKNFNRKEYTGINLGKLQELVDKGVVTDTVNLDILVENRLAKKTDLVKILGGGELKTKLKISVHKFTASAKEAVEKLGGEAITLYELIFYEEVYRDLNECLEDRGVAQSHHSHLGDFVGVPLWCPHNPPRD